MWPSAGRIRRTGPLRRPERSGRSLLSPLACGFRAAYAGPVGGAEGAAVAARGDTMPTVLTWVCARASRTALGPEGKVNVAVGAYRGLATLRMREGIGDRGKRGIGSR